MIVNIFKKIVYIVICKIVYRVKYIGTDNIKKGRSYVVACNHMSWVDPVALWCRVPNVRVMAKAELFKIPVFGWIITKLGAFPIKRGEKDFGSIYHSINVLKKDKCNLIIFPEGTRAAAKKKVKPKIGAVYLAIASGSEILPIHVTKRCHIFGEITVTVGTPYSLGEYKDSIKDKEMLNERSKELMEKIYALAE